MHCVNLTLMTCKGRFAILTASFLSIDSESLRMATVMRNAGQRISSDILVSAFTHQVIQKYDISIPSDIIGIIFMFWFIDVCDEWDEYSSSKSVKMDEQCAHWTDSQMHNGFGKKMIEKGIFEWKIKFKNNINFVGFFGVIKDDIDILVQNKDACHYVGNSNGVVLFANGTLFPTGYDQPIRHYCQSFINQDPLIIMRLDMDSKTITFKINEKQYETKSIPSTIAKFRLVITLATPNEVELL